MTTPMLAPAETLVPMASGLSSMILLMLVVFGFMFLVQRPLRKQQAAQRELQNQMDEGSRVMLTSGMFGTITHLGDKQAIVELAPGLEVTVLRQAISKAVTPDDEEFEFADAAIDPVTGTDPADDVAVTQGSTQPLAGGPSAARVPGEPWTSIPTSSTESSQAPADQQVAGTTHPVAPHDENR